MARPSPPGAQNRQRVLGWASLVLAFATAYSFYTAGELFSYFPQPTRNVLTVPGQELVFDSLYVAFGVTFLLLLSLGLVKTGVGPSLVVALRRAF